MSGRLTDEDLVQFVAGGSLRVLAIESLAKRKYTTTRMSVDTNKDKAAISRVFKKLIDLGLIEKVPTNLSKYRVVFYQLTSKGEFVSEELVKLGYIKNTLTNS